SKHAFVCFGASGACREKHERVFLRGRGLAFLVASEGGDLVRAVLDQCHDVLGPARERLRHLCLVRMQIVFSRDGRAGSWDLNGKSADVHAESGNVIEATLDDVRRDADPRHAGGDSFADVMKPPVFGAASLVKLFLPIMYVHLTEGGEHTSIGN